MSKEPPIVGRIIFYEIKEVDYSLVSNPDYISIDEKIEYIKSLFKFEEDKNIMNKTIENLLNQNKDE